MSKEPIASRRTVAGRRTYFVRKDQYARARADEDYHHPKNGAVDRGGESECLEGSNEENGL
jgi:hypothetical protein